MGMITTAFVFAAGKGTRMLPLTLYVPKPMVRVAGKMLIEQIFLHLKEVGVRRVIVNSHHLAEILSAWILAQREHFNTFEIIVSDETEALLETAGGLVKALSLLGTDPFFTVNGDVVWKDDPALTLPLLSSMAERWNSGQMDMLLALCPVERAVGYHGKGDFDLTPDGTLVRHADKNPYVYCGVQIINPAVLQGYPIKPFSLREVYEARKQTDGSYHRMMGMVYQGHWIHVGTVSDITTAEHYLRSVCG